MWFLSLNPSQLRNRRFKALKAFLSWKTCIPCFWQITTNQLNFLTINSLLYCREVALHPYHKVSHWGLHLKDAVDGLLGKVKYKFTYASFNTFPQQITMGYNLAVTSKTSINVIVKIIGHSSITYSLFMFACLHAGNSRSRPERIKLGDETRW